MSSKEAFVKIVGGLIIVAAAILVLLNVVGVLK